jgi:hypothetical protein
MRFLFSRSGYKAVEKSQGQTAAGAADPYISMKEESG